VTRLCGTQTEKNLLTAFAGESMARNRYTYFAEQARKEGYMQIADIFNETADQEKEHAKRLFGFLQGGEVPISAAFPAGVVGDTVSNLEQAAQGEHYENTEMYPGFAETAKAEGFGRIAAVFAAIAKAEIGHEKRFLALRKTIQEKQVFSRPQPVRWRCRNCGYIYEGTDAPKTCPACGESQAYFETLLENF